LGSIIKPKDWDSLGQLWLRALVEEPFQCRLLDGNTPKLGGNRGYSAIVRFYPQTDSPLYDNDLTTHPRKSPKSLKILVTFVFRLRG
jgi:hypothetical protein